MKLKSLMKYLLWILFHSHILCQGTLKWTVVGKATDYGQNVTLFCNVSNCCPKYAGWDMWTPLQRPLFIDVKTGRPNKKYDGKVLKDGYTLVIQNLTKQDLNVSYSCLYGITFGEKKMLLEEDVFKSTLEWTVVGKATDYGQNVTLFCNVSNCCPDHAGWNMGTPVQRPLFIDVKTGRPNKKYDGKILKDGYTLVIQNLTKQDLNVSYSCLYGITFGEKKMLLEEDVFKNTTIAQSIAHSIFSTAVILGTFCNNCILGEQ